ncbi:MAG: threonine--tRNA ligase, partial [Lachnospiraceae bacterium]|nr:threonine--tRNA ligase [Lachnospiraceae bacterium]
FKIREARMDRLPYMIVVGQKEQEEGLVSVRSRFKGDEGSVALDEFIKNILVEINTKEIKEEEAEQK